MAICIARHGETAWNNSGILQGWTDVPLNDKGREQSAEMAQAFEQEGFASVWSSPLIRASESAGIIAHRLKLAPPRLHEGLKERHFGVIQGIPKVELAELNPLLLQQIVMRNPAADFEGGEPIDEFADRVMNAVHEIGTLAAGSPALLITHGWVMDVLIRHVRGLPRDAVMHTKPKNGETLWVALEAGEIRARG
jgi:probable phosphoglycerate mutase